MSIEDSADYEGYDIEDLFDALSKRLDHVRPLSLSDKRIIFNQVKGIVSGIITLRNDSPDILQFRELFSRFIDKDNETLRQVIEGALAPRDAIVNITDARRKISDGLGKSHSE